MARDERCVMRSFSQSPKYKMFISSRLWKKKKKSAEWVLVNCSFPTRTSSLVQNQAWRLLIRPKQNGRFSRTGPWDYFPCSVLIDASTQFCGNLRNECRSSFFFSKCHKVLRVHENSKLQKCQPCEWHIGAWRHFRVDRLTMQNMHSMSPWQFQGPEDKYLFSEVSPPYLCICNLVSRGTFSECHLRQFNLCSMLVVFW